MAADGARLEVPAVVDTVLAEIAVKEGYRRPRFNVQSGSGARDGYTSALFRATVSDEDAAGRQDELSLMVKTSMPVFGDLMRRMYAAEGRMYDLVLPAMQEIAGLTEPLPWPRCVHALIDIPPPQCMVLADLRPSGYAMARCREALDVDHLRLALKALARFHGAGLALQRLRPDAFRDMHAPLGNAFDSPEMELFQPFVDSLLQSPFAEAAQDRLPKGSDVPAVLRRLFAAFRNDIGALMAHGAHGDDAEGYTIIHDDCHINNLLFQYDAASGAVTHCKLIDFQTANYGCPAVDLASLLFPGTERSARAEHWDGLLRGYHDELQATLRAAGIADPNAVYSWQLLQKHWRRVLPYGLGFAPIMYTAFCGDDEKILEMRETMASVDYEAKEGEAKEKPKEVGILVNDYVLKRYADLVEDVVRWGLMPTISEIDGWVAEWAAWHGNATGK